MKKTATVLPGLVLALVVGALVSAAVANANRDGHARARAESHAGARATAVRKSAAEQRVAICHLTGSLKNPTVTITVARSAVPAFMRQGDRLGACTIASSTTAERHENDSNAQSGSVSNQSSNGNDSGSSQSASASNQSNGSNGNNGSNEGRQGDSSHR